MSAAAARAGAERRRVRVEGVVQGVGFRPFVYGLARRHGLTGYVLNDGGGVVIEVEGPPDQLDIFGAALRPRRPRWHGSTPSPRSRRPRSAMPRS